MENKEIQKYIEDNCRNIEGGEMMDEQAFYEGAKWYRDNVVNKLHIHSVMDRLPDSEEIRQKALNNDEKDFDQWWWETVHKGN